MDIIKVTLTSLLSITALFVIAKLLGHKQVAQLDFFDYICGITIGSIGAELATELEEPYKPLIALLIYGIFSIFLTLLARHFPKTRKYINGTPTIIMNEGKIYRKNLRKAKLDLSEFLLLCREEGYFDLRDVKTAIFEHNGKLSVLPIATKRPATPSDMQLSVESAHIGTELILDGRVLGENLSRLGRDAIWLENRLKMQGYSHPCEVLLAVYHENEDSLSVYPNS